MSCNGDEMKIIELKKINKINGTLKYEYTVSDELKKYFSNRDFIIEYPDILTNIPDSILAIPFVCNVLPIIWMTNSKLVIKEIDKSFYNCIPNLIKGYKVMYPDIDFLGEISCEKIIENKYEDSGKSAMFYSGGLDSANTLIHHYNENLVLLSIWGSDIRFDNEEGWNLTHTAIEEAAKKFSLKEAVFRSTFREFDNEGTLDKDFSKTLGDGWWHGIKHGLALIGHVAPYVYLHKISKFYIASSNCEAYGIRKCASSPYTDNCVRFADCRVIHDGFEFSRQDKVHNIVNFCKNNNTNFNLHVCWESHTGGNCCHCEKCYRTICELIAEGEEPEKFGFFDCSLYIRDMRGIISSDVNKIEYIVMYFSEIKQTAINNKSIIERNRYYNDFKWILKTDFVYDKPIKIPFKYKFKKNLIKNPFYVFLHNLKCKIKTE